MREIKFRAWNKTNKIMYNVEKMVWANYGLCGVYVIDIDNKQLWFWITEIDILQFTGLKDKNGKEIYEGDVLSNIKFKDGSGYETQQEVYFENGCFGIGMGELFRVKECEVIGNIYKNPELMNK